MVNVLFSSYSWPKMPVGSSFVFIRINAFSSLDVFNQSSQSRLQKDRAECLHIPPLAIVSTVVCSLHVHVPDKCSTRRLLIFLPGPKIDSFHMIGAKMYYLQHWSSIVFRGNRCLLSKWRADFQNSLFPQNFFFRETYPMDCVSFGNLLAKICI